MTSLLLVTISQTRATRTNCSGATRQHGLNLARARTRRLGARRPADQRPVSASFAASIGFGHYGSSDRAFATSVQGVDDTGRVRDKSAPGTTMTDAPVTPPPLRRLWCTATVASDRARRLCGSARAVTALPPAHRARCQSMPTVMRRKNMHGELGDAPCGTRVSRKRWDQF